MVLLCIGVAAWMLVSRFFGRMGEAKPGPAYLREIEITRAAGLPVTASDMKRPPIPESENAAPLYLELVELLKKKPLAKPDEDKVIKLSSSGPLSVEDLEAGRKVLLSRSDISDLVHRAVLRQDCDFDRDYSLGPALPTPEYAKMRSAARWIAGEAALLTHDGKPLEAIDHAALGFTIGRQVVKDRTLIAYLVSANIDITSLEVMQTVLYLAGDQPGIAAAARHSLANNWKFHSLAKAMHGEVVMQTVILDNFRKYGPRYGKALAGEDDSEPSAITGIGQAAVNWPLFLDNNGITLLTNTREVIGLADRPYLEAHPRLVSMRDALEISGPNAMLAKILFPVYVNVVTKPASLSAKVRIVDASAALLEWKTKHGAFPQRLEQAVNPALIDPFDLKPLRYRKKGSGFVVYSVGETGQFDGNAKDKKQYNREAVFQYPAPAFLKDSDAPHH